jgi:hypothetical protein
LIDLLQQRMALAHYTLLYDHDRLRASLAAGAAASPNTGLPGLECHFLEAGNAMDVLWDSVVFVGHAIEQLLVYVETHHWIFGFLAAGYVFYLHDRALHARFDALDKRLDEIRKRLAVEY